MYHGKTIGVVIPAHNEEQSIGLVVSELVALRYNARPLIDKIVVCDNASDDSTARCAEVAGALVVREPRKGYGAACLKAVAELTELDCLAFVDGDHSMRATELPALLDTWLAGAHLVVGSRALGAQQGLMEPGSLPRHQQWGNRLASFLLTRLWATPVTDLGPFRVISPTDLAKLHLQELRFGWTVEMQAKALAQGYRVREVPVSCTRRIGASKVSGTWRGSLGAGAGILTTIGKVAVRWTEVTP